MIQENFHQWVTKKLVWFLVFIMGIALLVFFSDESHAAKMSDPAGDSFGGSPFNDFIEMEFTETESNYLFRIRFSNLSQGTNGCLLLDADGNRNTQGSPYGTITEYSIEFTIAILGICNAQLFKGVDATYLNCWVSGNDFNIVIPKSTLADTLSTVEIAAVSASNFLCNGRDRIPDNGYWSPHTGTIHIEDGGLSFDFLSTLSDPAGDEPSPVDLKGFQTWKQGEHLVFRVYYHHSIEARDIDAVSWNSVNLDLDKDILTGFQNTSEIYPTFGIDTSIQFSIYPWVLGGSVEANLYRPKPSEPEKTVPIQIGKFATDSYFRRSENWVEFSIPIALLPTVTQRSVVILSSMEPVAGDIDMYPDEGGLSLYTGATIPIQSCSSEVQMINDPIDDSFAFGMDNDEIVRVAACQSKDATLLSVQYKRLDMIGEALTALRMDLDSNANTGEIISNFAHNTQLGIEKTFVYQFISTSGGPPAARQVGGEVVFFGGSTGGTPSFMAILVEGAAGELLRGINTLVTVHLGRKEIYVTVPHRMFTDDGSMNLHTATMSTAYGTAVPSDEAPNSGVFSIASHIPATPWTPLNMGIINLLLRNNK